jgi:Na+-transporting NADH:ubiquinone oxidoreductase subunit C
VELPFREQFEGKHIRNAANEVVSVAVLKAGKHAEGQEQVDAISGATITSSGVSTMLEVNLTEYAEFLKCENEKMSKCENEGKEEDHVESEN